jgi:hypothetical protein
VNLALTTFFAFIIIEEIQKSSKSGGRLRRPSLSFTDSMERSRSWEPNSLSDDQEIPLLFYGNGRFITETASGPCTEPNESSEHGDEASESIKGVEFRDQLTDYQFLKKNAVA